MGRGRECFGHGTVYPSQVSLLLLPLALSCADSSRDDDDADDAEPAATETPESPYALGWPVDACSDELPERGTGHDEGDILPQYELTAQTEELVKLHDFCNQVVFVEFGYFT